MRLAQQAQIWHAMLRHLVSGRWYALRDAASLVGVRVQALRAALREFERVQAPIERDAYRGLRFVRPLTALDCASQRLPLAVDEQFLLDSTNTRALRALGAGLAQRKVFVADYQTQGRGRAQRQWIQGLGCGLSLSLAIPTSFSVALDALSLRVGVALAQAVRDLGVNGVGIKWPNDVLWQGKKLGGILIEARRAGIVIGIGLNHLRPRRSALHIQQAAVSLHDILRARLPARARVLARVIRAVLTGLDAHDWQTRFARFDALRGREIRVLEHDGRSWCGRADGIDGRGYLRVQTAQGVRFCQSAEVSVRLDGGGCNA